MASSPGLGLDKARLPVALSSVWAWAGWFTRSSDAAAMISRASAAPTAVFLIPEWLSILFSMWLFPI